MTGFFIRRILAQQILSEAAGRAHRRIQPHVASILWDTIVSYTSNLPALPVGIFICCLQILVKFSDSYFRQNGNTLHNTAIVLLYLPYSPFGILIGKTDIIVKSLSSDEKWRLGGQTEQSSFDVCQLISRNLQTHLQLWVVSHAQC